MENSDTKSWLDKHNTNWFSRYRFVWQKYDEHIFYCKKIFWDIQVHHTTIRQTNFYGKKLIIEVCRINTPQTDFYGTKTRYQKFVRRNYDKWILTAKKKTNFQVHQTLSKPGKFPYINKGPNTDKASLGTSALHSASANTQISVYWRPWRQTNARTPDNVLQFPTFKPSSIIVIWGVATHTRMSPPRTHQCWAPPRHSPTPNTHIPGVECPI